MLQDSSGYFNSSRFAAVMLGGLTAAAAITLRLMVPAAVGGDQTIFSFPSIIVATLLFGTSAGVVAASICWLSFWYFVVPSTHSFVIAGPAGAISLVIYLIVAGGLIWSIGRMREAISRFRTLNMSLERDVEARTAERNRLWERSRELLGILDTAGRLRSVNPSFAALLRNVPGGTRGRDFRSVLFKDDRADFDAIFEELDQDQTASFEARIENEDECVWVAWSMVREEEYVYLVGRDFTVEHALGERLSQSQKMEVIGQMAGGLAHDFGNLLPPISMTLHLLQKRHREDTRTIGLIEAANQSVDRAGILIQRLLSLSRPSRVEPRVFAVQALLNESVPLLRQAIAGRSLSVVVAPAIAQMQVDAHQLDMALLNLAVNARDATARDGKLVLTVWQENPTTIGISLSDDGAGMDAETLLRAQEPFFSTKPSGEGSGLGLPMVHNFAVANGGTLRVESTPSMGTTVTLFLPSATAPANL